MDVTLPADADQLHLWPHVEYLADSLDRYSAKAVFQLPDSLFERTRATTRDLPVAAFPVYVRLRLGEGLPDSLYFYISNNNDRVQLYDSAGLIAQTGEEIRDRDRPYWASEYVLPLYDTRPRVIVLRIYNARLRYRKQRTLQVGLLAADGIGMERILLRATASKEGYRLAMIFFLSAVGFIFLIMVVQYFQTRDRAYSAYARYIGTLFCYYFLRKLDSFQFEWSISPTIRFLLESVWIFVILFFYLRFLRVFLRLGDQRRDRLLRRYIRWIEYGAAFLGVATFLVWLIGRQDLSIESSLYVQLLLAATLIWLFWHIARRGDVLSRYMIFGAFLLLLGLTLTILSDLIAWYTAEGIDPRLSKLSYFQWAVLAELLVFWAGLSYREKQREREREQLAARLREQTDPHSGREDRPGEDTAFAERDQLRLPIPGGILRESLQQVAYFEAQGNYAHLYRMDGTSQVIHDSLKNLTAALAPDLLRIHRSFLVNRRHVSEIRAKGGGTGEVVVANKPLPVGRKYWPDVLAELG